VRDTRVMWRLERERERDNNNSVELVRVEKTTIEGIVAFKYAHTLSIIWDPNTAS
jgi:hypothetical protein